MTDSTPHVPFATLVKSPLDPIIGPLEAVPVIVEVTEYREVVYGGRIFDFPPGKRVTDMHLLETLTGGAVRALGADAAYEMIVVKAFGVPFKIILPYDPEYAG